MYQRSSEKGERREVWVRARALKRLILLCDELEGEGGGEGEGGERETREENRPSLGTLPRLFSLRNSRERRRHSQLPAKPDGDRAKRESTARGSAMKGEGERAAWLKGEESEGKNLELGRLPLARTLQAPFRCSPLSPPSPQTAAGTALRPRALFGLSLSLLSFYKSTETCLPHLPLSRERERERERRGGRKKQKESGSRAPTSASLLPPPLPRSSPPAVRLGGLPHQLPPDDQPPDL